MPALRTKALTAQDLEPRLLSQFCVGASSGEPEGSEMRCPEGITGFRHWHSRNDLQPCLDLNHSLIDHIQQQTRAPPRIHNSLGLPSYLPLQPPNNIELPREHLVRNESQSPNISRVDSKCEEHQPQARAGISRRESLNQSGGIEIQEDHCLALAVGLDSNRQQFDRRRSIPLDPFEAEPVHQEERT
jgi:hypothetical protein